MRRPRIYLLLLLLLGSASVWAQEPATFTIDFGAFVLEDEPDIFSEEYNFVYTGSYPLTPIVFNTEAGSFWEPVDMSAAIDKTNRDRVRAMSIRPIRVKSLGFTVQSPYANDKQSKVTNTVYTEMRGLQLFDPLTSRGFCWRCSPYSGNRFFR
ncbi:hypothetical protein [Gilvibacter sp.]|uniref:hypothetical protein n=1 Tax=Gilvibacter sp. TaxID=2729997 RepID=UPI003F49F700